MCANGCRKWYRPLPKSGWHAPIVVIEDRNISQGHALNRGVLTEAIVKAHVVRSSLVGTHLFGKEICPRCVRAKSLLDRAGLSYTYHDVMREPRALNEVIARVKPIVGPRTPITVPQIWVGGADQLAELIGVGNDSREVDADRSLQAA